MARTVKKVYLPKWQRFFVLPLISFIWLFVGYMEFFNMENADKMGVGGFLFFSIIMIVSGAMTFLMTTGKLPAYIIEEEKEK